MSRSPSWIGNSWPDCAPCTSAAQSGCATYPWTCVNGHTLLNGFERLDGDQQQQSNDDVAQDGAPGRRLTPDDLAASRSAHEPMDADGDAGMRVCGLCGEPWPCEPVRMVDEIVGLRAALAAATTDPGFTHAEFCRFVAEAQAQRERAEKAESDLAAERATSQRLWESVAPIAAYFHTVLTVDHATGDERIGDIMALVNDTPLRWSDIRCLEALSAAPPPSADWQKLPSVNLLTGMLPHDAPATDDGARGQE